MQRAGTARLFEWGDELPTLAARRLDLRRLTHRDVPAIMAVFGDPEVTEYWSSPALTDPAGAQTLVDEVDELFASRTLFEWGIALRETDEVVGTCTLLNVDRGHRRAELGFALARRAWGRGLATEAVERLIRFCFESLDLHRIEADVDPQNERSLRLLERQGFRREGLLRERWHQGGEIRDGVFLGLLRKEWTGT